VSPFRRRLGVRCGWSPFPKDSSHGQTPGKQIAEATTEPLTKGGDAAEKIVKGNAVSGNASRAACRPSH
jgi:hypothetical protein